VFVSFFPPQSHNGGGSDDNGVLQTCTVCLTAFNRAAGAFSKELNAAIRTAFPGPHVMIFFTGYLQPEGNMKSRVFK